MGKDFESRMVLLLAYVMLALLVMATAVQAPVTQPIIVKDPASAQNKAPNCSDGIQNQGELAVDCAGQCIISTEEICDSIDNDKDCYIDEGGICEAPPAKSLSDDVCAFPDRQIGYENRPDYFAIMSPSCVIEDDVGTLDYRSTLNLTKSYNARNSQKETLQITLAIYEGGKGGRCSAVFAAYPDAAAAKKAAKDTENLFMPLKKLGNNYAYINETIGIGYWVKQNYLISAINKDYINDYWWEEEDCTELLEAYLAKIGSDLTEAGLTSQSTQDTQPAPARVPSQDVCWRIGGPDGEEVCEERTPDTLRMPEPDENGMVVTCEDLDEKGRVICKKVKASTLPFSGQLPKEEANSVVEGEQLSGQSVTAAEESQVEKIRRIAKQYNIYFSNYDDGKLLDALQKFGKKHRKELEEKYGSQEPSEDKMAEILKQFSEEEFGKSPKAQQAQQQTQQAQQQTQQPQKQSLFSKVKNFFKKLF